MKLSLSLLSKFIELPSQDPHEVRHVLDDLGLEVKDVEGDGARTVFNIETLANRGDHLYALGVARELSARYLAPLSHPAVTSPFQGVKATIPVRRVTEQCARYALLEMQLPTNMKLRPDVQSVLDTITVSAPNGSDAAKQTVRNHKPAIVDLLNFVQLELGQPMHAFDREKIDGELSIELSSGEETIEALDGKKYIVPPQSIVIRDRKKIVAVAGVIGCSNSMVTEGTTRVLIESACFDPIHVRKTARTMGISTDASYAFERGSDIEAVHTALRRVAFLAEGAGGAVKDQEGAHVVGFSVSESGALEKRKVAFTVKEIRRQVNLPRLPDLEILTRLKNLGYVIEPSAVEGQFEATVPSWRMWDVRHQEDIVEDIARSLGLARVKQELPPLDYETPESTELEVICEKIEPVLLGQGFFEVMTRSYYSAEAADWVREVSSSKAPTHIEIYNALERGYSHLKVTNIIHLASLLEQNHRHGLLGAKVFEVGRVFSPDFSANGVYPFERDVISLAASGRWHEEDWKKPEPLTSRVQLFSGVLSGIVRALGFEPSVSESEHPLLHPGVQGSLKAGRSICGHFGLLNPVLRERLGVKQEVLYAELDASVLGRGAARAAFHAPSDFPSVKRDVTLKIPLRERVGRVARFIEETKPQHFFSVGVVDDFRKEGEDFRRASFRLVFQSSERTLAHTEVDDAMKGVLESIKDKHGLELAA